MEYIFIVATDYNRSMYLCYVLCVFVCTTPSILQIILEVCIVATDMPLQSGSRSQ
jgi:hypothetical protein